MHEPIYAPPAPDQAQGGPVPPLGQFADVFRLLAAAARRRSSAICHSGVWCFEQLIGIYYVHVPIRMTVLRLEAGGLFVYAPVAP